MTSPSANPRPHTSARLFVGLLAIAIASPAFAATPTETTTAVEEMSATVSTYNQGGFNTPVASADGYIYWAYIADNAGGRELRLKQKKPDGSVVTATLRTGVAADNYHVTPSVGIDRNNRIHVAGDLHISAWAYYHSNNPHDISSFIMRTPPGGNRISYPAFWHDRGGQLFITFRHVVSGDNSLVDGGSYAGALARYTEGSGGAWGSYTMLGGTSYTPPRSSSAGPKTLFWTNEGPQDIRFYQGHQPGVFFDANNRMHVSTVLYDNTCPTINQGCSHVIYAYSDDGGNTFRNAAGTVLSAPLGLSSNATAFFDPNRTLSRGAQVAASPDGRGVIRYNRTNPSENRLRRWTGSAWTDLNSTVQGNPLLMDGYGILTLPRGGSMIRSHDLGATMTWPGNLPTQSGGVLADNLHLNETGNIRFYVTDSSNVGRVQTVTFSESTDWADNLIRNSSIEAGTAQWQNRSSTLALETAAPYSGVNALRSTNRTQGWMGPGQTVTNEVLAEGQGQYRLRAKLRVSASSATIEAVLRLNINGAWIYHRQNVTANNTGWTTLDTAKALVWSAAPTNVEVYFQTTASTTDILVDKVSLMRTGSAVNLATGGTASASGENLPNEGVAKAFDGSASTKWLTNATTGWIGYAFGGGTSRTVTSYALTSANDVPTRDPRNWQLQGSNDGTNWTTLATETNQTFAARFERRVFTVSSPGNYNRYRLNITQNNGEIRTQFAELELY